MQYVQLAVEEIQFEKCIDFQPLYFSSGYSPIVEVVTAIPIMNKPYHDIVLLV